MELIDLHVHSTASDGTLSPASVTALAVQKGLTAFALTDHDTLSGIREAEDAAEGLPIEVVPGIELSCLYEDTEIHILGLYVDLEDAAFSAAVRELLAVREKRNDEMIGRFQEGGMVFSRADLTGGNPRTVITRAHFARVLLEKGYVTSMDQAFKKYLTYGGRYCPKKEALPPEQAMELLTGCGASPVIAHPYQYHLGDRKLEELVRLLKGAGLQGIEVYHSSNNQYESGKLRDLAKQYHLFPTGGSDFHGSNKPDIELGSGRGNLRVSALLLDDIKRIRAEKNKDKKK